MNSLVLASARFLFALILLSLLSNSLGLDATARAERAISGLYQAHADLATPERVVLNLASNAYADIIGFFWITAALIAGASLLVLRLGRRHHPIWFALLGLVVLLDPVNVHQQTTRVLIGQYSSTAFDAALPGISPDNPFPDAFDAKDGTPASNDAEEAEAAMQEPGLHATPLLQALSLLSDLIGWLAIAIVICWPAYLLGTCLRTRRDGRADKLGSPD